MMMACLTLRRAFRKFEVSRWRTADSSSDQGFSGGGGGGGSCGFCNDTYEHSLAFISSLHTTSYYKMTA